MANSNLCWKILIFIAFWCYGLCFLREKCDNVRKMCSAVLFIAIKWGFNFGGVDIYTIFATGFYLIYVLRYINALKQTEIIK